MNSRDPEEGWVPLGPQPRYLSNYVGLRNRISVLNEQYPYVDFETRVRGAYNLFLSFLDFFHEFRDETVQLVREADRRTISRGVNPTPRDVFIVEYDREPIDQRLTILGYEMEMTETAGGRQRYRPTDREATYRDVPYFARYTEARSVPRPYAYLVPFMDAEIVRKIQQHGVTVERLLEPTVLSVESFMLASVEGAGRLNQGHYTTSVQGEYQASEVEFPAGSMVVRTGQALGDVVTYLLEPESDDGLVYWNYFDRYLASQWGRGGGPCPIYKLLEPANLMTETLKR
jgi:hypothetical protein